MKARLIQKNIPEGWNEVILSAIGSFSKGASISKEQLSKSGHNAIRYGELYTKHNFYIRKIHSFISDDVAKQSIKIKYGDIIFAGSGETINEIGKSAAYLLKEDAYAGGDTIIFSPKKANSLFLSCFLNIGEGRKRLRELGQGQSVVHIYKSDIENLKLCIPPLPEQNRIVSVLETWDQAITKLSQKIQAKKSIKNALMIDFIFKRKDSRDYVINDLFELGRGRVIARGDIEKNKGKYPVYSSQTSNDGIFGNIDTYDFNGEYLTWTTDGANAGRVFYRQGKFNCTNVCGTAKLKPAIKMNLYFISSYLNYITKNYVSYVGNPKLMNGVFGKIIVRLPEYKDQVAVASVLINADRGIDYLNQKLSLLTNQKKYLLNNLITGAIRTPETLSINQ